MKNRNSAGNADHISYEYREIAVPEELSSLCRDSYPCFGWEMDWNREQKGQKNRVLYFRRNRMISNKTELTRLQRHFDKCVKELTALERAKTTQAVIAAMSVGLFGTMCMAGSTFAITMAHPMVWLMILLAIPGFLGWILPYFLYRGLVRKKTREIEPLIKKTYDEIYRICEQGNKLLH